MASPVTCLIAAAIVSVSCARPADAQGPEAGEGVEPCAIPLPTLQIETALQPVVREMCRRSLTFRTQLIRLADAPGLEVTVAVRPLRTSSDAAGITRFAREHGLLSRADVEIGRGDTANLVELISHELEHVLEQLDDVNLPRMSQGPGVNENRHEWRRSFETARARQIGLSVAADFKAGSVAAGKKQLVPR